MDHHDIAGFRRRRQIFIDFGEKHQARIPRISESECTRSYGSDRVQQRPTFDIQDQLETLFGSP